MSAPAGAQGLPVGAAEKEGIGHLDLHAAGRAGFVRAAAVCAEATSTRLGLADTTACAGLQQGSTWLTIMLCHGQGRLNSKTDPELPGPVQIGKSSPGRAVPSFGGLILII